MSSSSSSSLTSCGQEMLLLLLLRSLDGGADSGVVRGGGHVAVMWPAIQSDKFISAVQFFFWCTALPFTKKAVMFPPAVVVAGCIKTDETQLERRKERSQQQQQQLFI